MLKVLEIWTYMGAICYCVYKLLPINDFATTFMGSNYNQVGEKCLVHGYAFYRAALRLKVLAESRTTEKQRAPYTKIQPNAQRHTPCSKA